MGKFQYWFSDSSLFPSFCLVDYQTKSLSILKLVTINDK